MDLSIVIPTYNRNNSVAECVRSLEHNHAEIIVVDDGSPQPVELIEKVRVIRHERNRGRAAAVNTGLKAASHDLVLIVDDDIFATPDMVSRLLDEFSVHRNCKLALVGRVVWDVDIPCTLTMRWLEEQGPFRDISSNRSGSLPNLSTGNTLLWRPFVLKHGGFDENFTHYGLEDVELGLRLKQHGLDIRLVASAVGLHHKSMRIRDLVHRELEEGRSAVYLHAKFPAHLPQVDDIETLLRNETRANEAEAAVEELAMLEQTDSKSLTEGATDLFLSVYRHYFLRGILEGLREIGGLKARKSNSSSLATYNQASHLESINEFDEARRLFTLVLQRQDQEYWAGAEYHLGCIEAKLKNPEAAHTHFIECLRLNPGHRKARQLLQRRDSFREVRPNIFVRIEPAAKSKVLFVMFGALGDVINAFPVVAALRDKFHSSEIVWMTLPAYAPLARASFADSVCEGELRGVIPWDWVESEGFTHVFYPEGNANHDEWQQSGLHMIDFMAHKCGVDLESKRAWLEPGPEALFEAEHFLKEHGLTRKSFLTASHVGISSRHWPHTNLMKVAREVEMPTVVFGADSNPEIPGTISCFGKPFRMVAALIRWSAFFIGPDSGVSWIATTTNTAMGVFMDPLRKSRSNVGFRDVLRNDKDDIEEWGIHTSPDVVLAHIENSISELGPQIRNSKVFMEETV